MFSVTFTVTAKTLTNDTVHAESANDTIYSFAIPEGAILIDTVNGPHYYIGLDGKGYKGESFFLDGKQASPKILYDSTVVMTTGTLKPKLAIFHFGEKVRNGILVYESINKEDQFTITGNIGRQFDGSPILLFTFKGDSINSVDTTIIRNGNFMFSGKEYLVDESIITTGNFPEEVKSAYVILERGKIIVNMTDSLPAISGTILNDEKSAYHTAMNQFTSEFQVISSDLDSNKITTEQASFMENSIIQQKYALKASFAKNNISNLVGKIIIKKDILNNYDFPYFDELYTLMGDELKYDSDVARTLASIKQYNTSQAAKNKQIGTPYIDFEFQTPEGKKRKLSDYVGKSEFLLIDFWASWCGPCIAEIPNLKAVYDKYKKGGLEIISISLDDTKKAWQRGLDKIDAPWIHLCDFKGSKSELTDAYNIHGIPYILLLDKNGVILKVNLRGKALEDFLSQLVTDSGK
jgi:thiol-disulfide isomerase/thioredoxin